MKKSFKKIGWDYSRKADYMVTISVRDRKKIFGQLIDGEMVLSREGLVANDRWLAMPSIYPHVQLGVFVIMPQHIHGIIHIRNADYDGVTRSGTFGPQNKNLGQIIRGFKGGFSAQIREHNPSFKWQNRYHDRILFNDAQYDAARNYIMNNPTETYWKEDKGF
ncbi:MAG: REP element-mobilizing transposase RayT [Flavobacteriales bacterium]|jgi:putative transposase